MAERKLSLIILGKATSALAAMKSVGDEAAGLGKKVTDLLPSFKTVALAGAAAFTAVGTAAFAAAKAAADDQQSQKNLADQIRRTTGATDEQIASVENFISKQQLLTGVTDDELRPAFANLVRATGDVNFSQQALILAQDIAAATGKDLAGVSNELGKAFNGQIGALNKLGVPLDESAVKSKNLTELVKSLQEQFGGAAADAADTFSGRLKILQVSLDEAVEGIGYALLPFAERLVAFIQANVVPVIQAFSDKLAAGGGLRDALVAAGAAGGDFALRIVNALEPVVKAFVTLGNFIAMVGKPILYVLGAIASAVVLIATRSFSAYQETAQSFRDTADAVGDLNISTASVSLAFQGFRTDVLAAAAASAVTQDQLRGLEDQARRTAGGVATVVQPFIGPLLKGYGATATAATSATAAQQAFLDKLKQLQSQSGGAAKKVEEIADKMKKFADVVEKARDATRSAADATKGVQKAQTNLTAKTDAVAAAQARFDMVVRGFPASAKESIDATKSLANANRRLRDAGLAVADAQRGVQSAEKKLAELRAVAPDPKRIAEAQRRLRDATLSQTDAVNGLREAERKLADLRALTADPENVAAAERDLERSKYAVEEANFSVVDAERKLAELRASGTADPIEIRRAEIALAEAKLSVSDSVRNVSMAEQRLSEQRNASATADQIAAAERDLELAKIAVTDATDAITDAEHALAAERAVAPKADEIAEAERELERAKLAVVDALDAQTEATAEQSAAQQTLNEITLGAAVGSVIYEKVLKELEDAKRDQQEASDDLTRALRDEADAMRDLLAAQQALEAAQAGLKAKAAARIAAGLGVTIGAGGTISESVAAVAGSVAGSAAAGTSIVMNVQAGISNPVETANAMVDALQQYVRVNGNIPLPVAVFE